jgi:hypothetical protein
MKEMSGLDSNQVGIAMLTAFLTFLFGLVAYIFQDMVKQFVHRRIRVPRFGHNTLPLSELLGVDPEVRRLLALEEERTGRKLFAIGRCIELVRCPNLKHGWPWEMMSFSFDESPFVLKEGFNRICCEWKQNNLTNPDKDRFILSRIAGMNTSDAPYVHFEFKKSSFGKIFPIQDCLDKSIEIEAGIHGSPRNRYMEQLLTLGESPIPNFLVFHVLVETADKLISLVQRSGDADYYPRCWSASFEEQLAIEDFNNPFQTNPCIAGVLRGLEEEFGVLSGEVEQIKLLSVFLEYDNLNTACCAVANLKISGKELQQRWSEVAGDKAEAGRMEFIDSDPEKLLMSLSNNEITINQQTVREDSWHPSTKLRVSLFCASEQGMSYFHQSLAQKKK